MDSETSFYGVVILRRLPIDTITPEDSVESLTSPPIPDQFVNRPHMVGEISRHRWRARQSRMHMTEIVHAARPEQRRFQPVTRTRWRARAPDQGGHPRAQGRIQPLDIRRVDAAQID